MIISTKVIYRGKVIPIGKLSPLSRRVAIECVCELCGKKFTTNISRIAKHGAEFCSNCIRIKRVKSLPIGSVFGYWTVIGKGKISSPKGAYSLCRCKCGTEREILNTTLREGRSRSCGCYRIETMSQENNPNWNPNKSCENKSYDERSTNEYATLRAKTFERDKYICVHCGKNCRVLNMHHLDNYKHYKDERLAEDNVVTLCYNCHKEFHRLYGKKCTKEDFIEYQKM